MSLGGRARILGGHLEPLGAFGGVGGLMGGGHLRKGLGYGGGTPKCLSPFRGGRLFVGDLHNQTPESLGCWCPGVRGHLGIWVLCGKGGGGWY